MDIREYPAVKIHQFVFLMDKLMDRELRKTGDLSFAQFMILGAIHFKPGLSQRDIAIARQTTEAAVSRHITSLAKKGFVVAKRNAKNRKEHILKLTKKGQSLFEKDVRVAKKTFDSVGSHLSKKQTIELSKSFDILLSVLQKEFPEFDCA